METLLRKGTHRWRATEGLPSRPGELWKPTESNEDFRYQNFRYQRRAG